MKAGLDAQGRVASMHLPIAGQSILAALRPQNLKDRRDPVVFAVLNAGPTEGAFGDAISNLLIDHAMRNPPQIEARVEGALDDRSSAALVGEIRLKNGRIEQSNVLDGPVLQMAQLPAVETFVMPWGGFWAGAGGPRIAVAAPALLNATFAATGQRICEPPLQHDLRKPAA